MKKLSFSNLNYLKRYISLNIIGTLDTNGSLYPATDVLIYLVQHEDELYTCEVRVLDVDGDEIESDEAEKLQCHIESVIWDEIVDYLIEHNITEENALIIPILKSTSLAM